MDSITQITWLMYVSSGLIGYLSGSLSFARILIRIITKSSHIDKLKEQIPGSDLTFESDSVSATVVTQNLDKRFGCLTALLDMFKVALPTFLVHYYFPAQPYFLLTGLAGLLGHDYPIYHKFQGGRGESPMIGAMLVINWFGIFIANGASMILGYLTGSVLVLRYGWYVLMIFWYWIYFNDLHYVGFMILANLIFWNSMRKDLVRYGELKKENDLEVSEEQVSDFLLMGKGLGRFFDHYGLPALIKKIYLGRSSSRSKTQN
jgi:glycerol-3-phosphate acyltransferase PlsY